MAKKQSRKIDLTFKAILLWVSVGLVAAFFVFNTILSAYTNWRLYFQNTGVKNGTFEATRSQLIDFVVSQEVKRILKENEAKKSTPATPAVQ